MSLQEFDDDPTLTIEGGDDNFDMGGVDSYEPPKADLDDDGDDEPEAEDGAGSGDEASAKPTAESDVASEIDSGLSARAIEAGLTKEDMAELGATGTAKYVAAFDKRISSIGREVLGRGQPAGGQQPVTQQQDQQPSQAAKPAADGQLKLDWADLSESSVAKNVNQLHEHYNGRIAKLEQELQHVTRFHSDAQAREAEGKIDGWFAKQEEKFSELFGKGSGRKLGADSPQMKARLAVVDEAEAIAVGYRALGKAVPPESELLDRAFRAIHGDQVKKVAEADASAKATKQIKQITSRPAKRRTAEERMSAEEKATASVNAKLEKFHA